MFLEEALDLIFPEMAQDTAAQSPILSAQHIAEAFVAQYYKILRESPQQVHRYYKDNSILGRPVSEGIMSSVTTMKVSS